MKPKLPALFITYSYYSSEPQRECTYLGAGTGGSSRSSAASRTSVCSDSRLRARAVPSASGRLTDSRGTRSIERRFCSSSMSANAGRARANTAWRCKEKEKVAWRKDYTEYERKMYKNH